MLSNVRVQLIFCALYNGLLIVALFFLLPVLVYGVLAQPKRRYTFRQRMGWCRYPWQMDENALEHKNKCIWVHALSVGEVLAAEPLVSKLRALRANTRICFSTSTYTGFLTAGHLFGRLQRVDLAYFPYDFIWAVRNVASKINPSMVILTETDIWPNFLMEMRRRKVPVNLVNLRLSEVSWARFKRFKWYSRGLFCSLDKIGIQNPEDLTRLHQLGVPCNKMAVTGSIKFDGMVAASEFAAVDMWRKRLKIPEGKPVIVAGSTHEGEERILVKAQKLLSAGGLKPVLILAPRDPLRSQKLIHLCKDEGLTCILLSLLTNGPMRFDPYDVVLVDSIGVLKILYGLADIVFVGGSLVSCGGHNPLEPAAWGKPILFGPDMKDFALISELLLEAHGARRVAALDEIIATIRNLLADPGSADRMGRNALKVFYSHQGAVDRTLKFLGLDLTDEAQCG